MRGRTLVLSIAAHAVVALAFGLLATQKSPVRVATTTIELVAPARVPPAPIDEPVRPARSAPTAGKTGSLARMRSPSRSRTGAVVEDPRGEIHVETPGTGGDGDGHGEQHGAGDGRGIGLGDGARIATETVTLVTPPAPVASKARSARLVYPVRERDAGDAELFVARVTIDDEGFVVGAKLVRGFGGPRDAMAADLIWKFRYAPALDDEGRPIRSTFDQRFLVGR